MALNDPQSVTISGTAVSTPRISMEKGRTVYTNADGDVSFVVLQSNGKRKRTAVRIEKRKVAADPLTAANAYADAAVYIMVDRPTVGYSTADLKALVDALTAWTAAGSGANLLKVLGGES